MPSAALKRLPTSVAVTVACCSRSPSSPCCSCPVRRRTADLWGFPFFYWYQFVWVFLAAGFTYAAYVVVRRAAPRR